ncbi:DNA-binding transcriptional LysR family regulator [Hoeflea marina]|uniref:DNA-binding transcriptional LysR family regulator n=1 Tax=Hoeflea marina TaxID=274592 RepID=A0A317PI00_9HYPH|nr:LysR family transcriptional regulator [Hoeflea marina]PWW00249.1 DNA-binding transcriptional LysR family regulator [Hoeflea marina]
MKLDPRHLELLAAIVDHGGLTEGAEAMGKSQPSVSRSLALLETRLGTRLFEKGKRPLKPTEICLALAAEGRRIIEAGNSAGLLVSRYREGKSGVVRVGGTPIFMDGVISGMIADFQMAYPDIRIDQSYDYAAELMRRLETGSLDVAICPMNPETIPDEFEFARILPGRNVIACSVVHPLARRTSVKLSDIAPYPWIAPPANSPLYEDLRNVLASIGMRDFKVSFSGGSLTSVVTILERSDALTVLPYSVVFMLRRQKALSALSIRIGHPERSLGMLWPRDSPLRPSVRRFRQFIAKEFTALASTISKHEQNALWRR